MDVIAEFEMKVELGLREPEPVSEETLDLHGDEVMNALEHGAAEIALGFVISMDIPNRTIEILFDLLGDSDAEIYEKLAEVIRVILRETGLPLRVAKSRPNRSRRRTGQTWNGSWRKADHRLGGSRRRRRHQLDSLAALEGDEVASRAPMLTARLWVEVVVAEALEGGFEVGDADGDVAARRHHRRVLVHEVDLGAFALDPGEAVGERGRRLDPPEAEQLEEEEGALDLGGGDLDSGVLEHHHLERQRD
jgi:hypothetical protein